MKRFLNILIPAFFFLSCNDGEIIVSDFNFENPKLELCGDAKSHVLFKLNNKGVNEAIALRFDLEIPEPGFFATEEGQIKIPLNNTNQVIYRVFDEEIKNDYFCNEIPPVNPRVTKEFRSSTGGMVVITAVINNSNDHDGDGVPSSMEGMSENRDTDGDGIPDYLDIDDDGDNVPTRIEIAVKAENMVGKYPDSDNDGVPDYLDADDDNDGVPTRNEDWNQNLNPADDQNEEKIPHYLNPDIKDSFPVKGSRENNITRSFRYLVKVENLTLVNQGGDGEQIRLQDYDLGYLDSPVQNITIDPTDPDEEEQEPESN